MGDGLKLKEIIDKKGTNVRKVAMATGISASTLYTIIQKDSNIRFDFALRLADELGIEVNEICSAVPFSGDLKEDEIYFTIHDSLGILNDNRVRTYVMNNLLPLMKLYGKNAVIDIDKLLTSFYQLNDQARVEVAEMIELKLKYSKDEERAKQIKELKR